MGKRLLLLLLFVLLFACQDRFGLSDEQGRVQMTFNTDSLTTVISKAAGITAPELNAFAFRIENTRGTVLRSWESVADVPKELSFVTGSYRFVAWYGTAEGFPSWDKFYWQGEYKCKINAKETSTVPVAVKLGVVQVSVSFDKATFDKYYTDYSADVRTTTPETPDAGFLNFTPEEGDKAGRFLPGTLRLRLRMTEKRSGKEVLFSPKAPVRKAVGAEFYKLDLKIKETHGFATLVVTTDTEVTEIPIEVTDLPSSILPKAPPRVRSVGYDYTQETVSYTQGMAPTEKLAAAVDAPGGIRSLRLVARSKAMSDAWGGVEQIELVGISLADRNVLERCGFSWSSSLDSPETAAKATSRVEVRFDELFRKLQADPNNGEAGVGYDFSVEVVDVFDQSSTISATFLTKLQLLPPVFGWTEPIEGNVWASHASFELRGLVNIPGAEPVVEYRREDQNDWQIGTAERQELIGNGRWRYTIRGLVPDTDYVFRTRMGKFTTAEFNGKTEATFQMPNSDMERWGSWKLGTKYSNIYYYRPWAEGDDAFWTTNNDRTTAYRTTGFFGTTYAYNCFPAVSYTATAYGGKLAAEVRTTSASNIDPLNSITISQKHSTVAGLLFCGSFTYADKTDKFDYGQPWSTRPAALDFYYTYSSYNNDKFSALVEIYDASGSKIGDGLFTSSSGASIEQYTKATVPITYIEWPARAAKIVVLFRSSVSNEPPVRTLKYKIDLFEGGNNVGKDEEWNTHTGSILRLDELNLRY